MPILREYKTCYREYYGPLDFKFQPFVDMSRNSEFAVISGSSALSSDFSD